MIRAFVREPHETERFGTANDRLTEVSITTGRWMSAVFPMVMFVMNASTVAVMWFGGMRIDTGAMQIGRSPHSWPIWSRS